MTLFGIQYESCLSKSSPRSMAISVELKLPIVEVSLEIGALATYILYTSIAARGGGGSFKRLKLYNSEEHLPIESFVTTLIH